MIVRCRPFEVVRLELGNAKDLETIAVRMRATLIEVLGQETGGSLYSLDWLRDRAASHLDGRCIGAIFVARREATDDLGHIIVRQEADEVGPFGLVSTIYVRPEARRACVAKRLVDAAHRWFERRGLQRSATDTSQTNVPLIRLFGHFGYEVVDRDMEQKMVRLVKCGPPPVR